MTGKRLPTLILPRFLLTRHVGSIIRDLFLLRPRKWQTTPILVKISSLCRHSNPQLCPMRAIETYVAVASELRVTLSNGYLFRPTNHQGHIVNKPLTSSSAEARLKYYLKDAKIDEGETLHGFCSGSAITLALSGSQLADVMSHVGWSNKGTALYYMKLAKVLREGSPSDLLSSNELAASASTTLYADLNRLKDFVSAFPRS